MKSAQSNPGALHTEKNAKPGHDTSAGRLTISNVATY